MPVTRSGAGRERPSDEVQPPIEENIVEDDHFAEQPPTEQPDYPIRHQRPPGSPSDAQQQLPKITLKEKSIVSERARRIFRAKEKIAKLKLQLAEAKLAALEADDSEDENSISTKESEGQARVAEWLEKLPRPTKTSEQIPKTIEQTTIKPKPKLEEQNIQLSELAAAIALAARPSHSNTTPKYIGELAIFNGSHTEWLAFRAAYSETSEYFSDIENTARLRRALKGKAREAVSSLLITSTRPTEIMSELETRFGRPDTIALAEIDRLRNVPRPTDNPRDICQFASKIRNSIATLRALNRTHYLYNPEVVKQITEKLTPSLRYRWFDFSREQPQDEPDLLQLFSFVTREADTCGKYAEPEQIVTSYQEVPPARNTYRNRPQRTHTTSDHSVRREHTCPICKRTGHTSVAECEKFKKEDSNGRWELAKQHRLCFRCLHFKNFTHRCKTKPCGEDNCQRTHHSLLHYTPSQEEKKETETVSVAHSRRRSPRSFLKILPVQVVGPKATVNTYALLDDGSTVTLIDADVAIQVGAGGPVEPLNIEAIAGTAVNRSNSQRVTLTLRGQSEEHTIKARTMRNLKLAPQAIDAQDIPQYRHLADVAELVQYDEAQPTILIGQDNWELLLAQEIRRGTSHQPVASRTPLGWVLHGSSTRCLGHHVHHVYRAYETDERLEDAIKKHFSLESLIVLPKTTRADPDERALKILRENTIALPEGGYTTSLLWKTEAVTLPNNYDYALTRLYSTERKIDKNSSLKQEYEKQIEQLIEKNYAEEVATLPTTGRTWYLPHFPVLHPAKPGKVRPVFDAAARTKGTALNDHLLSGPDLLKSLPGVLMRFRQHRVAVAADIQEMFLRIKIREEDRDALRFLWRPHRREGPPREYRMKSVIFGAASSPCTALYVKNYNAEKYREEYPDAADAIIHHHYMDDYLQSFRTEQEALRITQEVRIVHEKANFHLRKWSSNSNEIRKIHRNEETTVRDVTLEHNDTEKILGLIWNPIADTLSFNLNFTRIQTSISDDNQVPTKREALRTVMSLFDPLGLASPVTIQAKQLLQEAWRLGTGWDEQLPAPLSEKWTDWLRELKKLRDVNIPRCHTNYSQANRRELHTFVDASQSAYAAAVYWKTEENGESHVTLAAARARVAPLKLTSIPRLELQAAVLGCRLAHTVAEEYQIKPDRRYYWSDSRTVLAWLRAGPRAFKTFVAHRVAEIEEETHANEWLWVPTRHNVADDATRGVPLDFNEKHRWFTGPAFLYSPPEQWPVENKDENIEISEERIHVVCKRDNKIVNALPDVRRFSSWLRLIRASARVLQTIDILRESTTKSHSENVHYKRTLQNKENDPEWKRTPHNRDATKPTPRTVTPSRLEPRPLQAEYMIRAEQLWTRASQEESFTEEITALRKQNQVPKDSRLRHLAVKLDIDFIIKLKSRIAAAAEITEQQKSPPVLDGDHLYTRLYISWVHKKLHHGGVETVMNEVRQHYWILRARPTVRSIVKQCQVCRLRRAVASVPPTGDHPASRLAHHHRPFTHTGLDYFGPLSVTVGRQHHKRYVALFTCLTTRAVHLELAASLSTDSAIQALRRMMTRRGRPTEIWSDNGTNLRGADAELQRAAINASREEAANRFIRWRYISPGAPFMGGAWERLVRSVKTALATTLHEKHPHEETLSTLLCEAEYTVNSRPLTHVSVEDEDEEALTPNHFLLGGSGNLQQPGSFTDTDIASKHHWKQAQRLADIFWTRWLKEYLPDLQYRREPYGHGDPLRIGDLVLVADSNLPRNTWPRGKVIEVYPGRDGVTRTADIKTKNGVLRRPTKRLVVLPTTPTYQEPVVVSPGIAAATSPSLHGGRNVHDE